MLNVVEYGKDGYEFPALIVLGCFDAIHLGHRELLKKAKLQAKINGLDLGVMMFRGGKSDKLVLSFEERLAILEQFNVKFVLAVDYNDKFKAIAPLDFLHSVEEKINVKAYMSGKDFRFGAQAKGKSSTLKNYAEDEENGVWYMPVKDVVADGEKVSTTLVKSCLDKGDVKKANELLGGEFNLSGEVVKGEGRGTSIVGFPTVNIVYPEWKYPIKHGVYSVKCVVGDTDYQGIANFGTCPTFGDNRIALEVYLEGFSGDLYGQTLKVRFEDYIRDIETFDSPSQLTEQLQSDLQTVSEETVISEKPETAAPAEEVTVADSQEQVEETPAEEPIAEEAVADELAVTEATVGEEAPAEEPVEVVEEQQVATEEVEATEVTEATEATESESDGFEELAEEPVEQPVEEVSEETIQEPTVEEIAEEAVQEPSAEEITEEVVEEPVEETREQASEDLPENVGGEGEDGVD